MAERANLIAVRNDVAATFLIDGLFAEASSRLDDPLPAEIEALLDDAPDPRAARLGWFARVVEVERFDPAREPMPWLRDLLRDGAGISSVSAALTAEEPDDKPSPADAPPSWRVPGPGGHVRHFLALRAGALQPDAKRSWMFGFFARCCAELSA